MTTNLKQFPTRTLSVTSTIIPELAGVAALTAVSISGTESVDSLFDYQLILKTPDALNHLISETANFDTWTWLGQDMSVRIRLEGSGRFLAGQADTSGMGSFGAGMREINGTIAHARLLRVEGRSAFYEVRLKPRLFAATLKRPTARFIRTKR